MRARHLLIAALLLSSSAASAFTINPLFYTGPLTAGHCLSVTTQGASNGQVQDSGGTCNGGGGGVSSVGLTAPGIFAVSGGPVTSAGTLALSFNSQSQNLILASPSGSSGVPSMRALTTLDLPVGTSVADPGTGTTEALFQVFTSTGTSLVYGPSTFFRKTRRSNSGSAMADTLPAAASPDLVNGTWLVISNVDTTAVDTLTAGSGTTIGGNATAVVEVGRSVWLQYDAPNTTWRYVANTGTEAVFQTVGGTNVVGDILTMRSIYDGVQDSGFGIGTSGANVPLLNGNLTWGGTAAYTGTDTTSRALITLNATNSDNVTGGSQYSLVDTDTINVPGTPQFAFGIFDEPTLGTYSGSSILSISAINTRFTLSAGVTGTITNAFDVEGGDLNNLSGIPIPNFYQFFTDSISNGNGCTTCTVVNRSWSGGASTAAAGAGGHITNVGMFTDMSSGNSLGNTNIGLQIIDNGATPLSTTLAIDDLSLAKVLFNGEVFVAGGNLTPATFGTTGTDFVDVGSTITDQTDTGTIAKAYNAVFRADTLQSVSAITLTSAFGTDMEAPVCSTNVNCTNTPLAARIAGADVTVGLYLGSNDLLISATAPTISSGFGSSPAITNNNGTGAFLVNVGTGGSATSGVIGMPTASNGWACSASDVTTESSTVFITRVTANSPTSVTIGNFNTSGAPAAWVASDKIAMNCAAY